MTYPTIDMKLTGQNIRSLLWERGLTVRNVQEFLGLSTPQSIYHWLDGSSMPTLDHLYALSELLCMPMDELIRGNRTYQNPYGRLGQRSRLVLYCEKFQQLTRKAG